MRKQRIKSTIKILASSVAVLVLVLLVFKASFLLISNSLAEQVRVDKTTSNYISFNYVDKNEHIIEVSNPKVLRDFRGKRLFNNNYFDFEVSIPDEYVEDRNVSYEIIVNDLGNSIDSRYIKFYLTDQDNNVLDGYEKTVPVYSVLSDSFDGKVIYSGEFTKNDMIDKYRLRIWVSKEYKNEIKGILAYHLRVRIK